MPPIASSLTSATATAMATITGVGGDVVAVVLGLLIFAVLFLVLEGIDRI